MSEQGVLLPGASARHTEFSDNTKSPTLDCVKDGAPKTNIVHPRTTSGARSLPSELQQWYALVVPGRQAEFVGEGWATRPIAMRDGPEAGLAHIEAVLEQGELADYYLAHSARVDMYRRLGRTADARNSYEKALALTQQEPERRFLARRLEELK